MGRFFEVRLRPMAFATGRRRPMAAVGGDHEWLSKLVNQEARSWASSWARRVAEKRTTQKAAMTAGQPKGNSIQA